MSFEVVKNPADKHKCDIDAKTLVPYPVGSIIRCRVCNVYWKRRMTGDLHKFWSKCHWRTLWYKLVHDLD